jgi:peptidylprolyl isomerase
VLLLVGLPALAVPVAAGSTRTPTRGPLSKPPKIRAHKGPAPKRLVIRNIIKGTGPKAGDGRELTVNYVGAFYRSGRVFDSSWRRGELFTFTIGRGEVIKGWERGLVGMRVGGRRELIIPAALAYGRKGSPPIIPPNSKLIFIVDLLAARSPSPSGSRASPVSKSAAQNANARAAVAPRCRTAGLVMWLNAEGSGTAGSFYYKLEFVNLSGRTCTLAGYPGVAAVNLSGRQVGASAKREATGRSRTVTLVPGGEATAIVRVVDVGALPSSCRPRTVAGFRVYPPGETASKVVPYPFRTCANVHERAISVRALERE